MFVIELLERDLCMRVCIISSLKRSSIAYKAVVFAGKPVHCTVVSPALDQEYVDAGLPLFGFIPLQSA